MTHLERADEYRTLSRASRDAILHLRVKVAGGSFCEQCHARPATIATRARVWCGPCATAERDFRRLERIHRQINNRSNSGGLR
jgi:hypothetical protein